MCWRPTAISEPPLSPRRPVWAIAPESIIVAPAPNAIVAVGEPVEIAGWAWSFRGIAAADISVDGGASFTRAALDPCRGWSWQRFSLSWRPTSRGRSLLCVRAGEAGGAGQPEEGARNAIHTVPIEVR